MSKHTPHGGATTIGPDATRPPAIRQNLWVGGGGGAVRGGGGGGWREGGGGGWQFGLGGGGCARPTTTTCIPQGGMCAWGHGGIEVCMR